MKIRLLKLKDEHLEEVRHWRMLPEITKYMYTDPIITSEEQLAWHENISNDPTVKYWVINVDEHNIGVVNLENIDYAKNHCECAYYIAEKPYRGKGLANIIEYNLYEYVFYNLGLHKLWFEVLDFNERAINLHKKFGCEIGQILKNNIIKNGIFYDVLSMSITKRKWQALKPNLTKYEKVEIE